MYMGFDFCLAVPTECAMGKVDAKSSFHQGLPQVCNLFALADAVSGNKSNFCSSNTPCPKCLHIPTADIIKIANVLPLLSKDANNILLLFFAHLTSTDERRVTNDVVIELYDTMFFWLIFVYNLENFWTYLYPFLYNGNITRYGSAGRKRIER